ncbi:lipase family protein [Yersinia mollaretii]|nr:lipase family protein [Yersinia mollaretii]QKJ04665.1 lipase family protein [Yersinia mollaretii ATCC 43969]
MSNKEHNTSIKEESKTVSLSAKNQTGWVEFQLLDEMSNPVANMSYRAINDATRSGHVSEYTGNSDASGIIRIKGLHHLDLTLFIEAQPLADEMETRSLRVGREDKYSTVRKLAEQEEYEYQYITIGKLCDKLPTITPNWEDKKKPPAYHFPDTRFTGLTVKKLNCRHVLEICPFRAWSLVLHHIPDYSVVNAYNLVLMSILSYADYDTNGDGQATGSISHFFYQQMLELSRVPYQINDKKFQPIVKDVPFHQRYTDVEFIDSSQGAEAKKDTQLFFAASSVEVIVAWRGTASLLDVVTDVTYKPINLTCDIKIPCSGIVSNGLVHQGFLDAFEVIDNNDVESDFYLLSKIIEDKELYICGHSLGGALALIHAAKLIDYNPILYTYGMPRTFTLSAMNELDGIPHYRHVNENDAVPSVPPERELDNHFYKLWGPLGYVFGYSWSVIKTLIPFGNEVFCHHGEVVHFFKTESVLEWLEERNPRAKIKIRKRLSETAKLFLVPCLSSQSDENAKANQQEFIQKIDRESKDKLFPKHGNPELKNALSGGDHPSGKYAEYIGDRIMELYDTTNDGFYKKEQDVFVFQMEKYKNDIPQSEYNRNKSFLAVDKLLVTTLNVTKSLPESDIAMQRYCLKKDGL